MGENEEHARKILENELEQFAYTRINPLGHAGGSRKFYEYVAACIKDGVACNDCKEKLQAILKEHGINHEIGPVNVNTELNIMIDGIYAYVNRFVNNK